MTTYNTGNPIGSTDARDRLDNTENMDYLENSTTELTHPDRLGTVRKTRHGMEVEHDAQMQSFENDFDGRLAGMAFTRVGSFTEGATLTDMRQVLIWEVSQGGDGHEYGWSGAFPKVVAASSTPATSGGIGAGAWVDRTDVTLRSELSTDSGPLTITPSGRHALYNLVFASDFKLDSDSNPIDFIQRAMDYCALNNKDLCISELYSINKPLIYKGSSFYFPAIYGCGANSGLQKTTNANIGSALTDVYGVDCNVDAVIIIPAITNQPKTVVIERVRLSGTDSVKPDFGIFATICENLDVSRCLITKVGLGILDNGSWVSSVEKTVFRSVTVGGYKKLTGTSTYINRCYVDMSGGFGFWINSGYSGIHNCACDKTSTYSYIVGGGASETTSDDTYMISNCGSENSGSEAVIRVYGAAFLSVVGFTGFNYDVQQSPTPNAFLEIESSYTHVSLNNVRYLGVSKFLNEIGQQNVIYLTGKTSRTSGIPFGTYNTNTKVIESGVNGFKFSRGFDTSGIALTNEDITDGNSQSSWCGLRNGKKIVKGTVSVTRTSGQSYGQATFSMPASLSDYAVSHEIIASLEATTVYLPICTVIKNTGSVTVTIASSNGSQLWSSFSVDLVIYGI